MLEGEVIMKVSSWARIPGPLDRYLRGFGEELARLGYAPRGVQWQLQLAGQLSAWLAEAGRGSADLDAATAEEFLAARRALGYVHFLSAKALKPLLEYLRQAGAAPLPVTVAAVTPADALLERFRSYLTSERGLTAGTAWNYVHLVRPFVAGRQGADGVDLAALTAGEVAEFVVAESRVRPAKGTQHLVSALRSLLGFAHVNGLIGVSLAEAVPSVASWRLAGLPRFLEPGQAGALLASCDTGTVNGRRDLAILTVLVRLGLRSGEVAGLALEDIDWRGRGVGSRGERGPRAARGRAGAPATRTAAGIRRRPGGRGRARRWPRSGRCCGTGTRIPPRSTPRSTPRRCALWPGPGRSPGREVPGERRIPAAGRLPAAPNPGRVVSG